MTKLQTQGQRDMADAAGRVQQVHNGKREWAKVYGGLCHTFPVLVKTSGLAQAWAYHESKAGGDAESTDNGRKAAHGQIMADVKALLPTGFHPCTATLSEYMRATRRVLSIYVFYKLFAVSILKAEASESDE